jgi:hypothetical protein
MTDEFSRGLREVADDMAETDFEALRRRVDARSRQIGIRVNVARAAAAVVVAAAVAGGTLAVAGGRVPEHVPPAAPPSPSPSVVPSAAPAVSPGTGPSSAPSKVTQIPGTLTFLDMKAGKEITVTRVVDGEIRRTSLGAAQAGEEQIAVPSPDGTSVAVIVSPDRSAVAPGTLKIIWGNGQRRTLADNVAWGGGLWPTWTPDGKAVIVGRTRYEVATGARSTMTVLPELTTGYLVYGPGGVRMACAIGDDSVWTAPADGVGDVGAAPGDDRPMAAVQAVSDDGRYLAVGYTSTDPSHVSTTQVVYDTHDKTPVVMPAAVGVLRHAWFGVDGRILAYGSGGFALVTTRGALVQSFPEVPGVEGTLVAHRG